MDSQNTNTELKQSVVRTSEPISSSRGMTCIALCRCNGVRLTIPSGMAVASADGLSASRRIGIACQKCGRVRFDE